MTPAPCGSGPWPPPQRSPLNCGHRKRRRWPNQLKLACCLRALVCRRLFLFCSLPPSVAEHRGRVCARGPARVRTCRRNTTFPSIGQRHQLSRHASKAAGGRQWRLLLFFDLHIYTYYKYSKYVLRKTCFRWPKNSALLLSYSRRLFFASLCISSLFIATCNSSAIYTRCRNRTSCGRRIETDVLQSDHSFPCCLLPQPCKNFAFVVFVQMK